MPGAIIGTAEVMRHAVVRSVSAEPDGAVPDIRPKSRRTATTMCPSCRSHRAFLWGSRPGKDWYFCPNCARRWNLPAPS
jgi:transposase-like protein